ncbi:MAG: general secretion pathway protein GspK [Planctomycetaceae bacterium]|nr:general secretion pathway protein GspK [Planctomycetaceae bacterium]
MLKRRGFILVVVLIVVVLMTLSVYAFSRFMLAERKGTDMSLRQTQVRLLAESGSEYLRMFLAQDQTSLLNLGGVYDNESELCGHIVTDGTISMTGPSAGTQTTAGSIDDRDVGRFSVIAPMLSEDGVLTGESIRYGLEDESAKLNLRWIMQIETAQPGDGRTMLMRLPGVTEDIADALLDWMDEDSEERDYGAEDEYYGQLDPPYYTRNALPDSLDELLLVRGITPKLLYGIDWNRNGVIDLGEPDESTLDEFDVYDGSLNLGLISLLTLDSREPMFSPEGLPKINVNMDDLEELRTQLAECFEDETWVDYIIQYRQQGAGTQGTGTQGTGTQGAGAATATAAPSGGSPATLNSLLDLVGNTGSPFADDPDEMNEYLPLLYDNLMLGGQPAAGRININQASRTVLQLFTAQESESADAALLLLGAAAEVMPAADAGVPPIDLTDYIEDILAERVIDPYQIEAPEMNYPFWIYTHGIVTDLAEMKQIEPYFCGQGAVFKASIAGRFDEKPPTARLEVWIDASECGIQQTDDTAGTNTSANGNSTQIPPAAVIRFRDITQLGPGYAAELLGTNNDRQ